MLATLLIYLNLHHYTHLGTWFNFVLFQSTQTEVIEKLERLGHRVGESLVERTSRDSPRFRTELDAVVFICKHFWSLAFNKPIDNLKTNHQVGKLVFIHPSFVKLCTFESLSLIVPLCTLVTTTGTHLCTIFLGPESIV